MAGADREHRYRRARHRVVDITDESGRLPERRYDRLGTRAVSIDDDKVLGRVVQLAGSAGTDRAGTDDGDAHVLAEVGAGELAPAAALRRYAAGAAQTQHAGDGGGDAEGKKGTSEGSHGWG